MSRLKRLIQEIHRRSLWQVLGIYLVGAWVAFQGIEALADGLAMPEWVPGFAVVVLILGLPIVLATAFVQEGVGGQEAPAPAEETTTPADAGGLTLVLTWRNVLLGGLAVVALAGVGVAGWFLLGGEISRTPETIRSIAVLPLENLTGDPGQEYFADGMTEAVISEFARLGALSVVSRTSVMRYKQSDKSLPEIAQELNVQGVVEGSVFRAGDRVRITLQLIDARDDSHIWAQSYERDLSDVLALQGEIARAVAEQIRLNLTPDEHAALTPSRSVDPRAYDLYLEGFEGRGKASPFLWALSAIPYFRVAVKKDPNFAEAHAALAEAHLTLGVESLDLRRRSEFPKAREAAQRALEIDDRLGRAHISLGEVRLRYDWDFAGARRAYERAMQLSPNDPAVLAGRAWLGALVEGRTEEGLDLMKDLLRVAPLDLWWRESRVAYFFNARQYERVLEEGERIRELDPDFAATAEAGAYARLGRFEEAHRANIAAFEKCREFCAEFREALERGWDEGGWEGSIRAAVGVATDSESFSPFVIATSYASIGETEEAFAWLERSYRERDPLMINLKMSPALDPLRSDPRYQALLRRIGFPEE